MTTPHRPLGQALTPAGLVISALIVAALALAAWAGTGIWC